MAVDVTLSTALWGVTEVQNGLRDITQQTRAVGNASKEAGQKSAAAFEAQEKAAKRAVAEQRSFFRGMRDVTQAVAGAAAVMSLFARNNDDLQRTLEVVSLTLVGMNTVLRAFTSIGKLIVTTIGLKVVAIGALIAAGLALIFNWEAVKSAAVKIWNAVSQYLIRLWHGIATIAEGVGQVIVGAFKVDWSKLKPSWEGIKKFFTDFGTGLAVWASGVSTIFEGMFKRSGDTIKKGWQELLRGDVMMQDSFAPVGKALAEAFDNPEIRAGWEKIKQGSAEVADVAIDVANKIKVPIQQVIDFLTNKAERMRQLAEAQMDYDIKIGRKTLADKLVLLQLHVAAVAKSDQKRLEAMNKVAGAAEALATKELSDIKRVAVTRDEQIRALEALAQRYRDMGTAGAAALHKVNEALVDLRLSVKSNTQVIQEDAEKRFEGIRLSVSSVVIGVRDAWDNLFINIMTKAKTFGEAFKSFWQEVATVIMSQIARIVASKVWNSLFKGTSFEGMLSVPGGSKEGGTAQAGTAAVELARGAGEAAAAANGAATGMEQAGAKASGAASSMGGFSVATLQGATAVLGFASFLMALSSGSKKSSKLGILGAVVGVGLAAFTGGASLTLMQGMQAASLGAGLGATLGGLQHGGSFTVSRPSLMAVGEMGPERVSVTPMGTGVRDRNRGTQVIFNAPVIVDGVSERLFARRIQRSMDREARRYA